MTKNIITVLVFSLLLVSNAFAVELTGNYKIKSIVIHGTANKIAIFTPTNDWDVVDTTKSPADCADTDEVIVLATLAGYKEIVASVLSAKVADAQVRFYGVCDASNPSSPVFQANIVVLY